MDWTSGSRSLVLASLLSIWGAPVEAQKAKTVDPLCPRVLPAENAGRLSGQADLQLVPRRSIPAAGGTCNYAAKGRKMVFLVTVLEEKQRAAEAYARYKGQAPYQPHQTPVPGLADEAFTGGEYQHLLVARKGSRVILLASMLDVERDSRQMHPRVSREQLVALARQVIDGL
jgi:hypothetical protein